jgi:hypothetical protein
MIRVSCMGKGRFRLFKGGCAGNVGAVKKLSKAILIALAAVIVLVVAMVFGVNLYIQSPGVQTRIQEEISRALRVPLRITNTSLTPWSDLRITGISIPNGGTNLLEAAAFRARYRLSPLLQGKLVIYDMTVESPKIVWPQNAEGKWELPKPGQAAAKSAEAGPATPQPVEPALPKEHVEKPKKKSFEVVVEGFEIKHGSVDLFDNEQKLVATFTDVNMLYTTLTPERVEGTADIGKIVWAETLTFDKVHLPFSYTKDELDLPKIEGTIGGGAFDARFNLLSTAPKTPFTFGIKFDQVDIGPIAKQSGWGEGQATGKVGGVIDLKGTFPKFARAEGTAHVTLQNGRFHEFSYFEMIGQALQIKQLSDLRLTDSSADAHIADEKLNFDNLTLNAADLQLVAKGLVRFDGKLQLTAKLSAKNSLIKQLPGLVKDNFLPGDNDSRYIDFNISGKAAKPKTDLLDKIVGQKLEDQFDTLVNGLFGSKKKKDDGKADADKKKDDDKKKKKKKDEPSAADGTKKSDVPASAAPASAATPVPAPTPAVPAATTPAAQ